MHEKIRSRASFRSAQHFDKKIEETGRLLMATVGCRREVRVYNLDGIMDQATAALSLMREAGLDPNEAMMLASADDSRARRAPRQRHRRPDPPHPRLSDDMRVLFRHFVESGMPLSRYAKDWLGVSRVTVWSWFQKLSYPYPSTRAQIKARTGIEIGPEPANVDEHLSRSGVSVSRSQEQLARSRALSESAKLNNDRSRISLDETRLMLDRLNRKR